MLVARIKPYFLPIMWLATIAGCDVFDPKAPAQFGTSYEFGFTTVATFHLGDVQVYMNRNGHRVHIASVGFVGAMSNDPGSWGKGGGAKGHLAAAPARIPDQVFITWFDHRGDHEQVISLNEIVPDMDHFEGTIWFVFGGDKWQVSTLTKEQTLWRETHGKGEIPID